MKSSPWTWPLSWYWLLLIWNRESRSDINTARPWPGCPGSLRRRHRPPSTSTGPRPGLSPGEEGDTGDTARLSTSCHDWAPPWRGAHYMTVRTRPDLLACGALWENITDSSFCITQSHTIEKKYQQQSQSHLCPHQSVIGWHPLSVVVSN